MDFGNSSRQSRKGFGIANKKPPLTETRSLLRDCRRQQRIHQIRRRPVENPVRHLLQRDPGADNRKVSGRVRNRQGPERNTRGILTVFLPVRPPAQEPVAERILR